MKPNVAVATAAFGFGFATTVFFAAATFATGFLTTGFGLGFGLGFGFGATVVVVAAVVVVVAAAVVVAAVVVAGAVTHADEVIVFVSSVTAPLRASTRPSTVAPVVTVMLVRAMTVPRKLEPVPIVVLAELRKIQKHSLRAQPRALTALGASLRAPEPQPAIITDLSLSGARIGAGKGSRLRLTV